MAAMLDKGGTASEGGEIEREERSGNVNSINSMEGVEKIVNMQEQTGACAA